jgi:hypothetical protein
VPPHRYEGPVGTAKDNRAGLGGLGSPRLLIRMLCDATRYACRALRWFDIAAAAFSNLLGIGNGRYLGCGRD